jgi:hypothetical protein
MSAGAAPARLSRAALRRQLHVVHGGDRPLPAWRLLPAPVFARSPLQKDGLAILRLAQPDVDKASNSARYQPVFDLWSMVCGKVPPIPNYSCLEAQLQPGQLLSIQDAYACFQGLRRPCGTDSRGFDRVVYISKPTHFIEFAPSLACVGKITEVPGDLVFATYVRLDQPAEGRYGSRGAQGLPLRGVVTHAHFVEVDPADAHLPVNFGERYRLRRW